MIARTLGFQTKTESFCICDGKEEPDMIGCDTCDGWYHPKCVGVDYEKILPNIDSFEFICPKCKIKNNEKQNLDSSVAKGIEKALMSDPESQNEEPEIEQKEPSTKSIQDYFPKMKAAEMMRELIPPKKK